MSNLWYLLIVVVLSCVGMLLLWVKNRDPISPGSSVDQFQDKMQALAPQEDEPGDSLSSSVPPEVPRQLRGD
ncbi:MAG: hypothetical protein WD029_04515 [Microthrixaceae bacterium]